MNCSKEPKSYVTPLIIAVLSSQSYHCSYIIASNFNIVFLSFISHTCIYICIYTYSYLNDFHYLNGKTAFLIIINMKNRFACKTNRHAVNFIYLKMYQNTVKLVLTTTCQQRPIQNRPKQFYYITEPPNNDHLSTTANFWPKCHENLSTTTIFVIILQILYKFCTNLSLFNFLKLKFI